MSVRGDVRRVPFPFHGKLKPQNRRLRQYLYPVPVIFLVGRNWHLGEMYMCVKVVSLVTFYIWVPGMTQCKHGVWICGYPSHGGMMSWAQKPSRSVTLDYCTPLKQVGLRNPKVMGQTVWEIQVFRRSLELSTRLEMCDSVNLGAGYISGRKFLGLSLTLWGSVQYIWLW